MIDRRVINRAELGAAALLSNDCDDTEEEEEEGTLRCLEKRRCNGVQQIHDSKSLQRPKPGDENKYYSNPT